MNDRSNNSSALIFGVLGLIVILILVYFLFLRGGSTSSEVDINIQEGGTEQAEPSAPAPSGGEQ